MKTETKSKIILALKIISAIVGAVLTVLGVGTLTSCTSMSSFTMSADTLYMDKPNISVKDSIDVKPFFRIPK